MNKVQDLNHVSMSSIEPATATNNNQPISKQAYTDSANLAPTSGSEQINVNSDSDDDIEDENNDGSP